MMDRTWTVIATMHNTKYGADFDTEKEANEHAEAAIKIGAVKVEILRNGEVYSTYAK